MAPDTYAILSDVTVPSPRIRDRGALQHIVVVRDEDGTLYNVTVPAAAYTPELGKTMAAQQRRLKALARLDRLLRPE